MNLGNDQTTWQIFTDRVSREDKLIGHVCQSVRWLSLYLLNRLTIGL